MDSSSVSDLGAGIQARALFQQAAAQDASALRAAAGAHSAQDAPDVAAKKFESLLATQLVKEMRRSLGDGFFGEGPQADVYSGWLDQYLGEALARDGGLHLAGSVRRSLEQKQAALDAAENVADPESAIKSDAEAPITTNATSVASAPGAAGLREETR